MWKTTEKINKTKNSLFKKRKKTDKPLDRLIQKKRERAQSKKNKKIQMKKENLQLTPKIK